MSQEQNPPLSMDEVKRLLQQQKDEFDKRWTDREREYAARDAQIQADLSQARKVSDVLQSHAAGEVDVSKLYRVDEKGRQVLDVETYSKLRAIDPRLVGLSDSTVKRSREGELRK